MLPFISDSIYNPSRRNDTVAENPSDRRPRIYGTLGLAERYHAALSATTTQRTRQILPLQVQHTAYKRSRRCVLDALATTVLYGAVRKRLAARSRHARAMYCITQARNGSWVCNRRPCRFDELERGGGPGSKDSWRRMYVSERLRRYHVRLQLFERPSGPWRINVCTTAHMSKRDVQSLRENSGHE